MGSATSLHLQKPYNVGGAIFMGNYPINASLVPLFAVKDECKGFPLWIDIARDAERPSNGQHQVDQTLVNCLLIPDVDFGVFVFSDRSHTRGRLLRRLRGFGCIFFQAHVLEINEGRWCLWWFGCIFFQARVLETSGGCWCLW